MLTLYYDKLTTKLALLWKYPHPIFLTLNSPYKERHWHYIKLIAPQGPFCMWSVSECTIAILMLLPPWLYFWKLWYSTLVIHFYMIFICKYFCYVDVLITFTLTLKIHIQPKILSACTKHVFKVCCLDYFTCNI